MNKGLILFPVVLVAVMALALVWNPHFAYADNATNGTNQTGWIYATSTPSGADIYLNGYFKGTSPVLMNASVGNHSVMASKTGYQTQTKTVAVYNGQTTNVHFNLTIVCNDTDTSRYPTRNPSLKGTATAGDSWFTDYCIDPGTLNEYYCVNSTSTTISSQTYTCASYCDDGTCY